MFATPCLLSSIGSAAYMNIQWCKALARCSCAGKRCRLRWVWLCIAIAAPHGRMVVRHAHEKASGDDITASHAQSTTTMTRTWSRKHDVHGITYTTYTYLQTQPAWLRPHAAYRQQHHSSKASQLHEEETKSLFSRRRQRSQRTDEK